MPERYQRHRGFIVLFGTRGIVSSDGQPVQSVCPRCGQQAMIHERSVRRWFTLFLCPVFPIGAKKKFTQCAHCGAQFRMSIAELGLQMAASQQQQMQQAIMMYNSLRASPANSVTLNNLMLLYASLKEYGQAVSAAGEFPQALGNSEQCMTTLGRILLEQGRHAEALQWFDAALARNAMHGEASYYKALTLMAMAPPNIAEAIAAARAARTAAYPNAEALLRELENRSRVA